MEEKANVKAPLEPFRGKVFEWKNMIAAGLIAGLLFAVVQMLLVSLAGHSAWQPIVMIAGIVLGEDVGWSPGVFVPGWIATGVVFHLILSAIFAIPLGALVQRSRRVAAMGIGAAYGAVLFVINFYAFTAVFPWFERARSPLTLLSHLVFGAVGAYIIKTLDARTERKIEALRRGERPRGFVGADLRPSTR